MKSKTFISTLVLCVSLLLQVGCQQQAKIAQERVATPAGGPKIEFESLEYDFGKVGPGQKMTGQFKFTNTGDAPLKITKVEKCCGAVIKVDKEELVPGEGGVLDVQYTSSRLPGKMTKYIYINSNDEQTPRKKLTIRAEIVVKVAYEPRNIRLRLNEENAGCPNITLTSTDNQPFSITSFRVTNNSLTAEIDSSVPAAQFVLQPKVDLEKIQKIKSGRISIDLVFPETNTPPETVNISFYVLSRFTTRPSMLMIMYNTPEPVKRTLWITNNYGEDFEVKSTSVSQGHIKVLNQSKVGSRYQFSLEIIPPADENIKSFSDTFTVTMADGETFRIPCRGIYRAPKTNNTGE